MELSSHQGQGIKMQKNNYILITTVAVTLLLTVPLAFGMATVTIGGNSVTLESGVDVDTVVEGNGTIHVEPTLIDGHPAYRFQYKDDNNNLVPWYGERGVDFQITIPKDTEFLIYAYVQKGGVSITTDINIEININGQLYTIYVTGVNWYDANKGYYSAKIADENNVMQKIEMGTTLTPDHFMRCNEADAILHVVGQRSGTIAAKIEFAIIYA